MSALVLDGGVVHYEYFGRGRPLIFIHGWLGSWRYWVPTMDELSETKRVYAFDLWGFGDSDKSRMRYTVDNYVELLHTFVDELGVFGQVPLVGHALGATVAVSFANTYPEYVDRVMAVSLPLVGTAINRRFLSGGGFLDKMLGRSPMAGYDTVEQEAGRASPDAITQSVQSVMSIDLKPIIASLQVPLLTLYGESDNVVTPATEQEFAGLDASVRMITMPEARHFPMLDRSSQFNRLLLDFLECGNDVSRLELKEEWQRRIR
ncbi:MAG: alpha/beta hydrolase [Anaerolineae bacterium]|nr:alpha/beta hydrolase [Anaerolineae bacterium]